MATTKQPTKKATRKGSKLQKKKPVTLGDLISFALALGITKKEILSWF